MSHTSALARSKAMGRHLFGAAALLLGVAGLALHAQLVSNWRLPGGDVFIFVTSIAQIAGGAAMQFGKSQRLGAVILGAVYLLFSLTFVRDVFKHPGVFASWGNVFYQLSLVTGAVVAYGMSSPSAPNARTISRAAVMLLGVCNLSFAVEQVEFLARTAGLVPKWVPPNGMFCAIATTVAFGLAGISLLIGYKSLLASRLLGLMLALFGVAIWIPALIADPKMHSNWSEGLETFAIAGAAWIVAEFLRRDRGVRRAAHEA